MIHFLSDPVEVLIVKKVKHSMYSKIFLLENELIVRKNRVIERRLFDQYHTDHLQKDLQGRKGKDDDIKFFLFLLYIFALIKPRCR